MENWAVIDVPLLDPSASLLSTFSANRIVSSASPAMPCVRLRCRREKPRVSAFTSADIPKILALEPDLVLTFSDLQASIAADLIRAGIAVHAFNQRDIAGILAMIRTLGALVGATEKAEAPAQRCAIRWVRRCGELVQEIERGCTLLACAEQQMLRVPIVTARHPVAFPAVHRVQEGGSF
jgi:substrate-binding family protein